MGRKSTKENKNIYQISRENAGLSREAASEIINLSSDRIADIENGKLPHPDEVISMMEGYKNAMLCNYHCSNECEIGKIRIASLENKSLSRISIEMLNTLTYLEEEKRRFMEIVEDEEISAEEVEDFENIQERFEKMATVIDSLQLWVTQYKLDMKFPKKNKKHPLGLFEE